MAEPVSKKELEDTISSFLDELDGRIAGQTKYLESEIQDVKEMLQDINKRLTELEKR